MNKLSKNSIKLAIGLSILFALFYKIGFGEIWITLSGVNPWVTPFLIYFIGFGIYIEFYKILMIYSIGSFIGLIPISINGLGIKQGTTLYLYSLIGVPVEIVASMQIIHLTFMYTIGTLGTVWCKR